MRSIADIRKAIADGAPADGVESRRLALQATGRLSDPDVAQRLHARLSDDLLFLDIARTMKDELQTEDAMRCITATLDEIEAISRSILH